MIVLLLAMAIQSGPMSNGVDFGSCRRADGIWIDLRRMTRLEAGEMVLDSRIGRARISMDGQRFTLQLTDSSDGEQYSGDVGDIVNRGTKGAERADVFVTPGHFDGRPILYWRETYRHRSFRQGLLIIEPEAAQADPDRILAPLCEGRGGIDYSH